MHDGQFDHVGAVGLRKSHSLAPAFSRDRMLGQEVSARNPDHAEKSFCAIVTPDSSIDAIDTQVPTRVRRRGVTHHQLEAVASIPRRQRGIVTPNGGTAPIYGISVSLNVHARPPPPWQSNPKLRVKKAADRPRSLVAAGIAASLRSWSVAKSFCDIDRSICDNVRYDATGRRDACGQDQPAPWGP